MRKIKIGLFVISVVVMFVSCWIYGLAQGDEVLRTLPGGIVLLS